MTRLQKILVSILLVLLVAILSFDISFFTAIHTEADQLVVNYQHLKDSKIPDSMDDVTILYITDLQYGPFQNAKRTERVFKQIQELNPDILIFGGDLVDIDTPMTTKTTKKLVKYLDSVQAPLGKFAVWGEKDLQNESVKKSIKKIYHSAQIEILDNKNTKLTNGKTEGIHLIGLSDTAGIQDATDGISANSYNLLVTHQPDNLADEKLASKNISYALAGHSHATQLDFPLLGGYKKISGSKNINRDQKKSLSFPYYISTGLGCTHVNVRYRAKPEVNYYILKH